MLYRPIYNDDNNIIIAISGEGESVRYDTVASVNVTALFLLMVGRPTIELDQSSSMWYTKHYTDGYN